MHRRSSYCDSIIGTGAAMQKSISTPSIHRPLGLNIFRKHKSLTREPSIPIPVKSRFRDEYCRYSVDLDFYNDLELFLDFVFQMHDIDNETARRRITVFYSDLHTQSMLPITNVPNFNRMIGQYRGGGRKNLLRLQVLEMGRGVFRFPNNNLVVTSKKVHLRHKLPIKCLDDFRLVCSLIQDDNSKDLRKVHLIRENYDEVLGLFIRRGRFVSDLPNTGGVFVSRLVPGGFVERCGLVKPGDQIVKVNGVLLVDKTVNEAAEMMSESFPDLYLITKPANQN